MELSGIPICLLGDIQAGRMSAYEWYGMAARRGLDGIEMYESGIRNGIDYVRRTWREA